MDPHSLECLDFYRIRELLASHAATPLGRGLALTIGPVANPVLVRRWLRQVEELRCVESQRGPAPLGGLSDVRELVRRCAPPLRVSAEDLGQIGQALETTHAVAGYLAALDESLPELRHLAGRIGDFGVIAGRIRAVIDERGRVRDQASPRLAEIRAQIGQAASGVREVVERLLRDPQVRRLLQYPSFTLHEDRLVLPVKTEHRGRLAGIVHRSSDSGATLYIEPAQAVELNNRIASLRGEEAAEISRILWELAHQVHLNENAILRTLDALAVVDLIVAKLRLARTFDLRCPTVVDEPLLEVRQARHPLLLERARQRQAAGEPVEPVVPIDYRIGGDFDMLIITGPNTGGKTVTLKTVGLLTLMLQAGIPLPVAEGTRMGIFDDVLIDIGDEQSMEQSLSTFSAHLKRQMEMLRSAGRQTLVLIDELGAGTDPDEGAAIGRAILDELLRTGCRCLVTTHLGALKSFALTRPRAENACVEFDPQTLRPSYHLRIGQPGMSNALTIARRLGMPPRLLAAAERNLSRSARQLRAVLEDTARVKRHAEQARSAAEAARLQAQQAQDQAAAERMRLEQQQGEFQAWAQRVAHLRPGDPVRVRDFDRDGRIVRVRLDQQRAEVDLGAFAVEVPLGDIFPPQAPPPPPPPARPQRSQRDRTPRTARASTGAPVSFGDGQAPSQRARPAAARPPRPTLPSLTDEQAAALQPGQTIYVKRFHRAGKVMRIQPSKRVALVSVGLLEVEVPFAGLAWPVRREGEPAEHPTGRGRKSAPVAEPPSAGGESSPLPGASAAGEARAPATAEPGQASG